jgi:uncharacterized membrane protein
MTDPVPQTAPAAPAPKSRRGWRWLLIASLALNFLLIGLLAGGAVRMWRAPLVDAPAAELALLWRALPEGERDALRGLVDDDDDDDRRGGERHGAMRAQIRADLSELRALLVAQPFDRAALEARLTQARDRQSDRADRALARMLDRIEALPVSERARMAERIERRWERRLGRD